MKNVVLAFLDDLQIDYDFYQHKAAYTMQDIKDFDQNRDAVYCKNLFLRNANGKQHYLAVVIGDKRVDLKTLSSDIKSSRLGFASEKRLMDHLKLKKGHVGPFGLLNDKNHHVICVLDQDMVGQKRLSFHPNDNTATVVMTYDDFKKCLDTLGVKVILSAF
jgi:Ala-tRNA(Pro) deacylase